MKWDQIKDQFFEAAKRLGDNVDYITDVANAFETLVKILYLKDPATCIELINKDAEIVGKIFTVEDPYSIPPEAIATSSEALARTQKFLFTFLRVAHLFQTSQTAQEIHIPPGSNIH